MTDIYVGAKAEKNKAYIEQPEPSEQPAENKHCIGERYWSSSDGSSFFPVSEIYECLSPDMYNINILSGGQIYFQRINFSCHDLIKFSDSNIDNVIDDIEQFWKIKDKFKKFDFPYRRGILMYGPPGGGKSSATRLILKNVISKGGIGITFTEPQLFITGMRILRKIQPETPVVVIMEDIDSIMKVYHASAVLNILDGIDSTENTVYIATTNYPETLEDRIKNRPSRFDRRYEIGYPNESTREIYIKYLFSKYETPQEIALDQWVKDTKDFTIAHIKELFISVVLFEVEYDKSLELINSMSKNVSSNNFNKESAGFRRDRY